MTLPVFAASRLAVPARIRPLSSRSARPRGAITNFALWLAIRGPRPRSFFSTRLVVD